VLPYFIGDQFLYFNDLGYRMHVICSPSEQLEKYSQEKKFSYKEVFILRSISFVQDIKSIISIYRYIKSEKIDIVVGHTPKGALLSMIAAFISKVPSRIYFRHGLVYETAEGFKRKLLIFIDKLTAMLATQIVCVSPSVCQRSIEDKLNPERKQVLLSHGTCNGIDTNRFESNKIDSESKNNLKVKLGIPENAFVIGFTGRLVRDKGIIELVDAFDNLSKKYNNLFLLLVGMIEERDALPLEIVKKINENKHIIHTGFVDNSVIEYYYSLMDVFTLPSYREGFPTSVLEASSMELPVITSKATGCKDSIIDNKTGIFVNHNSKELSNAIDTFIIDKSKQKEFGSAGRQFVSKYFDQKIIWNCIEKLYKD
jgi:glycosyltransferase involved in cell wall biosynthesis